MIDWHTPTISDISLLQKTSFSNHFFANNYSALNSFLYSRKYNSQIAECEIDGSVWLFERFSDDADNVKNCFSFPHKIDGEPQGRGGTLESALAGEKLGNNPSGEKDILKNPKDYEPAIKLLLNEASANNQKYCFANVTTEEKEILVSLFPNAKIYEHRDLSDYIYLTENLANLPGSKYSKKRNHINQAKKKFSKIDFVELTEQNLKDAILDVIMIEEKWFLENSDLGRSGKTAGLGMENVTSSLASGASAGADTPEKTANLTRAADTLTSEISDLIYEKEIIKTGLDNFDFLKSTIGLSGGILYLDKQPAGFCLASKLSQNVTDIHFEKCLSDFARDGGYALINQMFAKTVQTKFINREEDLGIEGLRKAKLSYYPEMVIGKFCVLVLS